MNIIVCVKQVMDPEAPPRSLKIDIELKKVSYAADVRPVLDPYSEYAVEAALKLRDACGSRITALSLGANLDREVIRKPLSMGADELVLLEDEAFAGGDSYSTACALARAIEKLGGYDLILCGRQSADRDAGQVGPGIAALLGLPVVTMAKSIEVSGGRAKIERIAGDACEIIEAELPVVITISHEIGAPRYPTVKGIMTAKKEEPVIWKPADIGLNLDETKERLRLVKLFQPVREAKCQLIPGETPEEAGANLADILKQEKLI
jgi:electron transfer flavoprotein beta subunit